MKLEIGTFKKNQIILSSKDRETIKNMLLNVSNLSEYISTVTSIFIKMGLNITFTSFPDQCKRYSCHSYNLNIDNELVFHGDLDGTISHNFGKFCITWGDLFTWWKDTKLDIMMYTGSGITSENFRLCGCFLVIKHFPKWYDNVMAMDFNEKYQVEYNSKLDKCFSDYKQAIEKYSNKDKMLNIIHEIDDIDKQLELLRKKRDNLNSQKYIVTEEYRKEFIKSNPINIPVVNNPYVNCSKQLDIEKYCTVDNNVYANKVIDKDLQEKYNEFFDKHAEKLL